MLTFNLPNIYMHNLILGCNHVAIVGGSIYLCDCDNDHKYDREYDHDHDNDCDNDREYIISIYLCWWECIPVYTYRHIPVLCT